MRRYTKRWLSTQFTLERRKIQRVQHVKRRCAEDTRGLLHPGVCMYFQLQVCSKTHEIRDIVVFERLRILNKFFDMDKQQCSVKFKF